MTEATGDNQAMGEKLTEQQVSEQEQYIRDQIIKQAKAETESEADALAKTLSKDDAKSEATAKRLAEANQGFEAPWDPDANRNDEVAASSIAQAKRMLGMRP